MSIPPPYTCFVFFFEYVFSMLLIEGRQNNDPFGPRMHNTIEGHQDV